MATRRSGEHNTTQRMILKPSAPAFDDQTRAALVVIQGERMGTRIELDPKRPMIIGRSTDADLSIAQRSVSREHCRIWFDGGRFKITDLESTNHTYINQKQIKDHELTDGDHIGVGQTVLKFIAHQSIEARYHEELYQLATHDVLTGLHNRRHFMDQLSHEIERARRSGRPFSLLFFDLDRFKPINDAHGHLAGDQVLKAVADVLKVRVRAGDALGRIGGEEFAMIAPETSAVQAARLAEDLRRSIGLREVIWQDQVFRVTISIGIAEWQRPMAGASDILRAADAQLYRAKSSGRNRVCFAGDGGDQVDANRA